jgi:hypothetical protein
MKYIVICSLLFIPILSSAQDDEPEINVAGIRFLDFNNSLPENLLVSKSVVMLQLPPESKSSSIRADWRPMAEAAHEVFRDTGIDAVAYYFMDDVMSGLETRQEFATELKNRGIEFLIIISDVQLKIKNKETNRFVILITEFNGEPTLMSNGQKSWKTQNKDLDKALAKISKGASKQRLINENLLIVDYPELFRDIDIIKGRRAETYSNALRVDKVAFAFFPVAEIPEDRPGGIINNNIAKEGAAANAQAAARNKKMEQILQSYPFGYGITSSQPDELALVNQGYSFVILPLHTTGMGIRYLLDYEIEEGVSDYITIKQKDGKTTLRNIPTEAPVYKFYLKHLKTKDVYVGSRWDADETWEEALGNFISNVKNDFK